MRALTPPGGVPVPQSGPRPLPQPVRAKTPPGGVPVPVNTTSNNVPPELKRVYEFFDKGHWDKARGALEIMMDTAGSEEKKKSYEALISVANAKEAIQNNEPRIAQIETNRAAGLDASLQIVKSLRDEVFGKRK